MPQSVRIDEVAVHPLIGDCRFINLTGREEGLGIFAINHIAVNIHVIELVVETDALRLIIEFQRRLIVVDAILEMVCILLAISSEVSVLSAGNSRTSISCRS